LSHSGIYSIVINDKIYIGSAVSFEKRWKHHKGQLKHNKHANKFLQRTWNKHQEAIFQIICECPSSCLLGIEQYYINCFNLSPTAGNTLGVKYTEEGKKNCAIAQKKHDWSGERNSMFGKVRPDTIERNKTKKMREIASKSKLGEKNPNYGNHPTEETRQKMGTALKGNTNAIRKLTWDKVREIRTTKWDITQEEIAKKYNICKKQLWAILNNKVWKEVI